jgi:hypothetical protein
MVIHMNIRSCVLISYFVLKIIVSQRFYALFHYSSKILCTLSFTLMHGPSLLIIIFVCVCEFRLLQVLAKVYTKEV